MLKVQCSRMCIKVVRTLRVFTNWMVYIFMFRLYRNKCFSFLIFYAAKFSFSPPEVHGSWFLCIFMFKFADIYHLVVVGVVTSYFLLFLLLLLRSPYKTAHFNDRFLSIFHILGCSIRNRNTSCGIRSFGWNRTKVIGFVDITRGCGYVTTSSWWDEPSLESSQIKKYRNQVCENRLSLSLLVLYGRVK